MKNLVNRKPLFGVAILAGLIVSSFNAQPANAQMMDILKNALGGQLPALQNQSGFNDPYNSYGSALNGAGSSGLSGLLSQFLPGQTTANPYFSQSQNQYYFDSSPSAGGGFLNGLLPLAQNSGVGSNLQGSYLPQSQVSSAYGSNCPTNLSSGYLNGLPGFQNFGGVQPVVFNGVTLDSGIYTGPYRGSPHQVESAMNLDWQMTVLKEQIGLGAAQGYLMTSDANVFLNELNSLIAQKHLVVRRNGLSFADSQVLVRRLNSLVLRVRQAWYNQTALNNTANSNRWSRRGRFARANAYGQVLNQTRNEALERLYLMTRPTGGSRF